MTAADTPTSASTSPASTATTASGRVRGLQGGGVHTFRGIPFAAPPTGARRFRPPEPPATWTEVRDCTRPGPTAPQPVLPTGLVPQTIVDGDDCLHLDVHTSALAGRRPVLVWIHGGGMVMGGNADVDGRSLARRGLVVVAVNYRLGSDGFLCLHDAPPNRGVHDWIAALRWVQQNIAGFGGDPGNVTIAGQSAGSAACLTLLAVPCAAGLFRRVVAMSGTPWNLVDQATAGGYGDDFARRLAVPRTVDGIGGVPVERLVAELNAVAPIAGIGTTSDPVELFHRVATLDQWVGPVVDGDLIPVHPSEAIAAGAGDDVEVLLGSTVEETDALLTFFGASLTAADARDALVGVGLDAGAAERWLASLPDRTPGQALGRALTALSFRVPGLVLAGSRASAPAPTYVYETTWRPATPLGAVHGCDVPYVFDTLDRPWVATVAGGAPPRSLADDMAGAVVRFATTGDPGWPPYRPQDRCEMAFDVPSRARADPDRPARELFSPLR